MLATSGFGVAGALLLGLIIWAGLQSNLATELQGVAEMPWGLVTLADLSIGLIVVAMWIAVLERRWWPTVAWIVLLFCLGNLVTVAYFLFRLRRYGSLSAAMTRQDSVSISR